MRRMIGMLGLAGLMAAAGCGHTCTGGLCDCGPQPGDATMYAPFHGTYRAPAPAAVAAPVPVNAAPPAASAPAPLPASTPVEIRPLPRGN
jgi:hypothetical protein